MNTNKRPAGVLYRNLWEIDRILRGEATTLDNLRGAEVKIPVVGVSVSIIALAMVYGLCMGVFALVRGLEAAGAEQAEVGYHDALLQTFASMCKVPLLFMLTLLVTFPSLYVFNALAGSKLRIIPVLKLLISSLAVNIAVLTSMGPILAFFSVSTPNYQFIVLLNVAVFSVAGLLGLGFLLQTMGRLSGVEREKHQQRQRQLLVQDQLTAGPPATEGAIAAPPMPSDQQTRSKIGPLDLPNSMVFSRSTWQVFYCWLAVFCLVGCQMGWVLRPFIGSPSQPFQWFRERHSNFFEAVFNLLF